MLDKLNALEEGQTLFDEELGELFETIDHYMKGAYLVSESTDKYYFKYKDKCFEIHVSYAQDRTYYLRRTKDVECIDLEDIIHNIIRDKEVRERKEQLDALRNLVISLEEAGVSRSLINTCISGTK